MEVDELTPFQLLIIRIRMNSQARQYSLIEHCVAAQDSDAKGEVHIDPSLFE